MVALLNRIRSANASAQSQATSYTSIDSAPPGYAVVRSVWTAPAFLTAFAFLLAIAFTVPGLQQTYVSLLESFAFVGSGEHLEVPKILGFRTFFAVYVVTFWVFASGDLPQRLRLLASMAAGFIIATLLIDILFIGLSRMGGPGPFSVVGNVASGYSTLLLISVANLVSVRLPQGQRVDTMIRRTLRHRLILTQGIVLASGLVVLIFMFLDNQVNIMRDVGLLGGIGPGVFLFAPLLSLMLFVTATRLLKRHDRGYIRPSVAIIVPAFNEEEHIGDCIRSLDRAALNYTGRCRLMVIDNGSVDSTRAVAEEALAKCRHLYGKLLTCPEPGKSRALNMGLRYAQEEILVRMDADTVASPRMLQQVIPYFHDEQVGGVGGITLPKDESTIIGRMRAIEVYFNVGFHRMAQTAIDAVTVIPGIMSAYRCQLVKDLGGFAEGFNGEDTDMTVRVGRMGYKIIIDPTVTVFTEAPRTLAHLREQRLRWSRSFIHVFSRNLSAIWMRQGVRGIWTMPTAFWGVFRRSIVIPLLIFAAAVAFFHPDAQVLRHGSAVVAVMVGPVFLITAGVLIMYRRLDLLPYLPAYLFLRLFRAYAALEMLFTLPLREIAEPATATVEHWPLIATNRLWNVGSAEATPAHINQSISAI